MSGQKNNKVISLLAFRKKKQRQMAKKKRKTANDRDDFFADPDLKAVEKKNSPSQIYYMGDYLKKKNLPPIEEGKKSSQTGETDIKTRENVIILQDYTNRVGSKNSPVLSARAKQKKLIKLDDHRKKRRKKPSRLAKEAMSFTAMTAMALMMMFAFSLLFPEESSNRKLASALKRDKDKKPENQPLFPGKKPESPNYRGF